MFELPFDFFSLVIAIVAFIFARKAFNQAAMLRARLDAIEAAAGEAGPRRRSPRYRSFSRPWQPHRPALRPNNRQRLPKLNPSRQSQTIDPPGRATPAAAADAAAAFRNPGPASRSASAPAGWSGSAD